MSTQQAITLSQAEEAVYIDFEGNVDHAPSMLGVRLGSTTRQFVVEAALASYGELANPRYDVTVATLEEALGQVRELAKGRAVAGFTTHELDVVSTYCSDTTIGRWFTEAYVNVKKAIGRRVRRQAATGVLPEAEDRSMLAFMTAAGLTYKPGCGPGIVGP